MNKKDNETLPESLRAISDKLGVTFSTAVKVFEGTKKNWRNAKVRGVALKDQIFDELNKN